MGQQIKLIACDMDGTLLGSNTQVSPGNIKALEDAAAAGIHLCVASGRPVYDIERLMARVDAPYGYLSLNGALQRIAGHTARHPLTREQLSLCLAAVEREHLAWLVFTDDGEFADRAHASSWRSSRKFITAEAALTDHGDVLKMLGVAMDGDAQALARARAVAEQAGLAVSSSTVNNFEVNAPGVNKGAALRELALRLGLAPDEVMTIGDYENDREMLTWAGCSVAMGNAPPHIAALAKHQTGHHDEDGVAQAIGRWAMRR